MNHDILTFRPSLARPIPLGKPKPPKQMHLPSQDLQGRRIGPKLQVLSDAMENQCATLQQNMQGIDPEFVLVFEVVDGVDLFMAAAKRAGMEWLGDFDNVCDADEEFYDVKDDGSRKDSAITEKLYLTMTNHTAMEQMLSLWRLYLSGNRSFPSGYSAFRTVFDQLRDVRRWNVTDRFWETGVAQIWQELLLSRPEKIRFEIELWYRNTSEKREVAEGAVRNILARYGGVILKSSVHEEISYHGLVAECPAAEIQRMLDEEDGDLINAEQIIWIRASGQVIAVSTMENVEENDVDNNDQLPVDPPLIALLDGLPLENHRLLANRLDVNDANGYADNYQVNQRVHGTSMASLIIHGDLNHPLLSLNSKLYVRPIMKPVSSTSEGVPDDELFVDVLHKAIIEIGENEELRSTIKIINLSVGNPNRPFVHALSPEAKILDYLSEKYNLLIFVSSGNNPAILYLPMKIGEYNNLTCTEKYKAIYKYLWDNQADMKIIAPSESINSITVGAIHQDNARFILNYARVDPVKSGYPATYSCFGGGYARSIKPDCVEVGGKQIYAITGIESMDATMRPINILGLKSAAPTNGLSGEAYYSGTSDATAMSSRLCADLLPVLRNIPYLNISREFEATALKTMFIHCCSWGDMGIDLMNSYVPQMSRQQRKETIKWIGYGIPNIDISSFCTDQRVTLIGFGSISQNMQTELTFPLPPCLSAQALKKRLTITLAWMSPIAPNNKNYRLAKLNFDAPNRNILVAKTMDSDAKTSKRGTVQHEVYEGKQASVFEDGTDLKIIVSCKKELLLTRLVKFVLMATLEVAPETNLPIYQEVEARVRTQIHV